MTQFVVYIAMSLDGYIADEVGGVHWLQAFDQDIYGYEEFLQSIGSILMGRVTFDQVQNFGEWPYEGKSTLVWSGGHIENLPNGACCWAGSINDTEAWLKDKAKGKDVWVLGGARTINVMISSGKIDRMDIFVVPVVLGGGIRLFEGEMNGDPQLLNLEQAQPFANGVVQLTYTMKV